MSGMQTARLWFARIVTAYALLLFAYLAYLYVVEPTEHIAKFGIAASGAPECEAAVCPWARPKCDGSPTHAFASAKPRRVDSMSRQEIADIAASFQAAVVDVLLKKTQRAAEKIGARTILLGGGVAANSRLRSTLKEMCDDMTPPKMLLVAPKQYCTDNAVMVASLAYYKFKAGLFADLTLEPKATG